ncbi:MAG: 50S ribosomal protein L6 [Gammaproteobacteria bacterium]|nr:50S ribosomal protein L6 [Gammaproteobacteria bacterium]
MSRVAKIPVLLPKEVAATVTDQTVILKGSQGTMSRDFPSFVEIINKDQSLCVSPKDGSKAGRMFAGTTRALLANMLEGVATGFQKKLEITGVGYRAQVQGRVLNLTLGYSHPIHFDIPEGITIQTPSTTEIVVKGADKQQVGQIAANIRRYRPPEPYKGKGIRYAGEVIRRKEAKKA